MTKRTQLFFLELHRMCTSDDAGAVASWSGIIAEEDLPKVELKLAAELTATTFKDIPISNLRPMTPKEIRDWRKSR